jgi:hypothetical protein
MDSNLKEKVLRYKNIIWITLFSYQYLKLIYFRNLLINMPNKIIRISVILHVLERAYSILSEYSSSYVDDLNEELIDFWKISLENEDENLTVVGKLKKIPKYPIPE